MTQPIGPARPESLGRIQGHATENPSDRSLRVEPRVWVGLVAVVLYVVLGAGVANLLAGSIPTDSEAFEFALRHFTVLPLLIVAGLLFVRWAGWRRQTWRVPGALETQPRRRWLLAIPVLLLIEIVTIFAQVPWSARSVTLVVVVLAGTALVGLGEELYFRGILRVSVREHHGEFVTLVVTSVLFALAHSFGSFLNGVPVGAMAFQVTVLALDGAILYGILRATGRLWVAIVLHGLNDAALYLASGDTTGPAATGFDPSSWFAIAPGLLWVLALVLVVSSIREDLRARANRKQLGISA